MLYDVPAPAKLNLFLHVTGRRADGYHLLQSAFRLISLADQLDIDLRQDGRIERETDMPGVAHDDDLVVRAARLLKQHTGTALGAQINVRKHIPAGGGLGGGSSDAATVLIALNKLWNTRLTRAELMQLGLKLGADVPFFIFGENAFAEGVGEDLQAINLESQYFVVVQPAQQVPTQGIFQDPDLTRDTKPVRIMDFSRRSGNSSDSGAVSSAFLGADENSGLFGQNDLQPVVLKHYPIVRQAFDWCHQSGLNVRMTGSGSCLFAVFLQHDQAALAYEKTLAKMRSEFSENLAAGAQSPIRQLYVCDGLSEHPLRSWL